MSELTHEGFSLIFFVGKKQFESQCEGIRAAEHEDNIVVAVDEKRQPVGFYFRIDGHHADV